MRRSECACAASPSQHVRWRLLGEALAANRRGRLSHFIVDETSPAIALFAPEARANNAKATGTASTPASGCTPRRTPRHARAMRLAANLLRVADYLVAVQEADGYLGTYAPDHRFMRTQPPKP